jgi:nucleotide-binding universal stress UspA family protein
MIELTLGAIAAALIAKMLDRAGDEAVDQGEGALRTLVEKVRGRLSGAGDALAQVEEVPDSKSRVETLARVIDERAEGDPEFGRELAALVEAAQRAGVDVKSTVQVAYGSQIQQFADIHDSEINISYGAHRDQGLPRRISD